MASIQNFPDLCVVCQEDYDPALPRENLQVIRAKECPLHFVHEECALQWFQQHHTCAVCAEPCTEIVDIHGETVEHLASQIVIPQPVEPYMQSYYQSEVMQIIDIERGRARAIHALMRLFGIFEPPGLIPSEIALIRYMYERYAMQGLTQPDCQMCKHPCSMEIQAITVPCGHKFHNTCLFPRLYDSDGICPAEQCEAEVAIAGDPITEETHYIRWMVIDNLLQQMAGEPNNRQPPSIHRCLFCGENAADEERVITPCCHIFHSRCFDTQAGSGLETLRLCPLSQCQKPCLEVKRIPPQPRRPADQPQDNRRKIVTRTRATISRRPKEQTVWCRCCKKHLPFSESVRPNTCQHRYHRKCLRESTKSNKQCPRRHCKKKFIRIVE